MIGIENLNNLPLELHIVIKILKCASVRYLPLDFHLNNLVHLMYQ